MKIFQAFVRGGLTVLLLIQVYRETGAWTVTCFAFMWLGNEMFAHILNEIKELLKQLKD